MRSAVAKQHGLDEVLVARGCRRDPDLDESQRTAVDFADAMITDPAHVPDELRSRLRSHFTENQIIELALDVMKWSYQKVPVALGVDHEVRPGELTDLVFDADGNWVRPG